MQVGKSLVPLLLLAASMACTTGRANVIEDQPTLVVPPVPPRSIEPLPVVESPPVEPEPAPAAPVTPPARTKPAARNDVKPEPKPAEPPDPTTTVATLPNAPPPVAPLRTPATPTGHEAIRQVRDMVTRTESVLSRVDYQKLNPDRRLAYDTAKSFIQQAEEALKKEDLTLALSFAGRAENIAKQLEAR